MDELIHVTTKVNEQVDLHKDLEVGTTFVMLRGH